jgi:hypothetical protein
MSTSFNDEAIRLTNCRRTPFERDPGRYVPYQFANIATYHPNGAIGPLLFMATLQVAELHRDPGTCIRRTPASRIDWTRALQPNAQ